MNSKLILLLLTASLEVHAQSVIELIRCGDLQYARCNNDSALHFYRQAVDRAPNDFAALERMTRIYNDMGRIALRADDRAESLYVRAGAYAESLAVQYPDRAESHFWIALSKGSLIPFRSVSEKISIGKLVKEEASRTLLMDSSFALAYAVLAIVEREGSKLTWFEKTIVRVVFGEDVSGSLVRSEELLNAALRFEPDNSFLWYELNWTRRTAGDRQGAIDALRHVLNLPVRSAREELQQRDAERFLARFASEH